MLDETEPKSNESVQFVVGAVFYHWNKLVTYTYHKLRWG